MLTRGKSAPILEANMREQVEAALARMRPSLQFDGGDVQLLAIEDGVVRVALVGACAGCPMSRVILQMGLENSLKSIPEVKRVETVDQRVERNR
jgi:Fe-S cluster biogenesis protein NfuA